MERSLVTRMGMASQGEEDEISQGCPPSNHPEEMAWQWQWHCMGSIREQQSKGQRQWRSRVNLQAGMLCSTQAQRQRKRKSHTQTAF